MGFKTWLTIFLLLAVSFTAQAMYVNYSSNSAYIEYTTHFEFLDTPIWVSAINFFAFVVVAFFPAWGLVKTDDKED